MARRGATQADRAATWARPKTVRRYLRAAERCGLMPGMEAGALLRRPTDSTSECAIAISSPSTARRSGFYSPKRTPPAGD